MHARAAPRPMAEKLQWILRFVHILGAAAWVGGVVLWTLVLAPALVGRGPPEARRRAIEVAEKALPTYFTLTALVTLGFGAWLYARRNTWANTFALLTDPGGSYGRMFLVAGACGVLMLVLGTAIVAPGLRRILRLLATMPPGRPPDAAMQARVAATGRLVAGAGFVIVLLGIGAIAAMTYAVNLVR